MTRPKIKGEVKAGAKTKAVPSCSGHLCSAGFMSLCWILGKCYPWTWANMKSGIASLPSPGTHLSTRLKEVEQQSHWAGIRIRALRVV